jgi:glucose/arabinose dehydrogenase
MFVSRRFALAWALPLVACGGSAPSTLPPASSPLVIRKVVDTGSQASARLVRDPSSGLLYVLHLDGSILKLTLSNGGATLETAYDSSITGVPAPQGLAFGPDGTLYLVGNETHGNDNVATIRRGVRASSTTDTRTWSTLASTVPIPKSNVFDHEFNGIAVTADGRSVFVNSGARTDHGEIQTSAGRYAGLREVPLTALILRLPADGNGIVLQNDDAALRSGGYVFARGVRNSFDLALSADGELFAGDNSGDRDDNDELNWIREGHHYGFPWRMGTNDTPQQFAGYVPASDRLINHAYQAWQLGFFYDDPTYPARPATPFTDPIPNMGPDANSFRNPATGAAQKASDLGLGLGTFTAHRSPLGLVFDVRNELPVPFQGTAFILGWTAGYTSSEGGQGPFLDAGQDLLHLVLTRQGDTFQTTATRLVCGFQNPVDTEIKDGLLYVLEYGGSGSVWEIALPIGEDATHPQSCTDVPR